MQIYDSIYEMSGHEAGLIRFIPSNEMFIDNFASIDGFPAYLDPIGKFTQLPKFFAKEIKTPVWARKIMQKHDGNTASIGFVSYKLYDLNKKPIAVFTTHEDWH